MLEEQSAESGRSSEQEFATMREYYGVMKEAVHRGMHEDTTSRSGLTGMDAQRVGAYNAADEPCLGGPAGQAMAYALAVSEVNASMGSHNCYTYRRFMRNYSGCISQLPGTVWLG